jgi:RNA polymerase I-specific transcription initiation factor RRN6
VAVGLVTAESDEQGEEARLREDGWARILWVGDVNTVVVCNRRRLQGYGLKGGETVALDSFQPVQQHSADWILDIRKHDTNPRHFFLLTSSHLYLLAVICQNDVLGNSDLVPGVVVVLSWAHFRGMEDITLQLHVPALSHEGIIHS